jgi:hypothetical protein
VIDDDACKCSRGGSGEGSATCSEVRLKGELAKTGKGWAMHLDKRYIGNNLRL